MDSFMHSDQNACEGQSNGLISDFAAYPVANEIIQ